MRSFAIGLAALPAAMGLAVPFPKPNGTHPFPPGPTGAGSPWVGPTGVGSPWVQPPPLEQSDLAPPVKRQDVPFPIPNGTHPFPPGPTGTGAPWVGTTGAPWVQPPPAEEGDLAPPLKRTAPQLNEKRFFPIPNGTHPHPPSPSGTGAAWSTGTGAPWVQLPPADEGEQEMAPPVKRQLEGLDDVLKAPSDSLPVNVADLKDLPKIPKEFIPSMPIPVPFNGTWPIINGTFPPFNSTGDKQPPVPLPVGNLRH